MKEDKLLKILNEIEEEGRREVRCPSYGTEAQHGYGVMDAVMKLKKELNMEN